MGDHAVLVGVSVPVLLLKELCAKKVLTTVNPGLVSLLNKWLTAVLTQTSTHTIITVAMVDSNPMLSDVSSNKAVLTVGTTTLINLVHLEKNTHVTTAHVTLKDQSHHVDVSEKLTMKTY